MAEIRPGLPPHLGISRIAVRPTTAVAGGFTTMDLSAATVYDPNTLLDAANSTLGAVSTIALNNAHGLWDAGLDGLGFFFEIGTLASFYEENSGIVLRVKFASTTAGSPWRISMGALGNATAQWASNAGFMAGQLQGSCNARQTVIGGGGASGSNLGNNDGLQLDVFMMWNPLSSGNVGPAIRELGVTVSEAGFVNFASRGGHVTPAGTMATPTYAILGFGNTSTGAVSVYTDVECSYQVLPRQP